MKDGRVIEGVKRIGTGASFIAFPVMLLMGFALHPNLLSFGRVSDAQVLAI